ncbi:D-alanyl-D-alanine carboxypeptidase/D-alanyl-D-alanine-endopeptidase [Limnobacter humi]|uniref:D-alanyl-D-alanine carboxypeptidase/D-alanyl-D-alanine-endopeptidase n=1 Tax=Limnobacter humi TaxID=1778671 RepID=A0ABT1WH95_9BURK|nr:D-alanyl-D-alanine carboxypeptidase/D-alanyl-D-alanine-endopeptidase [Limnobacter humi]MCQ8896876.1 D-alanyl-D-alanine carboxypeptidase/D-alanyl-D-alanine-endopeptidase [Limnobacter humi]
MAGRISNHWQYWVPCLVVLLLGVQAQAARAQSRGYAEPAFRDVPSKLLKQFSKVGLSADEFALQAIPIPPYVKQRPLAYAHAADRLMNPASVAKVFTTGLALDTLNSTYRFKTAFMAAAEPVDGILNGPLYIRGGGDPGFMTQDLWSALRALRMKGVKTIRGSVVLDDTLFSDVGVALSAADAEAFDEAPHRAYNAQPYALLMNLGAMTLMLDINQGAVQVVPEEAPASWAFVSEIRLASGACGAWKNSMDIDFAKKGGNVVVTVKGSYPRGCGAARLPIRVPPQDWLWESWFREIWAQLGGEFAGQFTKGKTPANTVELYTAVGKTLAEDVRQVNKWSNNVMARHLELAVAGSPQAFNTKMLQWLQGQGIRTPDWYFENGSGLSRSTRVDARGLTEYLRNMAMRADFPDYLSSFPRAGVDGTLQKRVHSVDGYAYLKTGSLSGVRSVAGYVRDRDGQWWSVAILVKSPNAGEAWPAMEAMVDFLYRGD